MNLHDYIEETGSAATEARAAFLGGDGENIPMRRDFEDTEKRAAR